MYLTRTPRILHALYPGAVWSMPGPDKDLFLTFDDGPIPEVTPWVLDTLATYQAKATFFCIGRNCEAHPSILARIRADGHAVGNHTWDHPRGWRTADRCYFRNVLQFQAITRSDLFRPPYGSLKWSQFLVLKKRFKVVLWDVLSRDYDVHVTGETCLSNVIEGVRPGSIVVFHDSLKAEERLRHALPATLAHFSALGYRFKALGA